MYHMDGTSAGKHFVRPRSSTIAVARVYHGFPVVRFVTTLYRHLMTIILSRSSEASVRRPLQDLAAYHNEAQCRQM